MSYCLDILVCLFQSKRLGMCDVFTYQYMNLPHKFNILLPVAHC